MLHTVAPPPCVPLTVPVAGGDTLLVSARGGDRPVGQAGLHAQAVLCDPEQLPDGELWALLHHCELQNNTGWRLRAPSSCFPPPLSPGLSPQGVL